MIGAAFLYMADESSSTASIYVYSNLVSLGAGVFAQSACSVVQVKVDPKQLPAAIGFITMDQICGATIALSISASVFLNLSNDKIPAIILDMPRAALEAARAGAGSTLLESLNRGHPRYCREYE